MAQIRTLKLNLLADVTKFGAGMVEARGDINKLSTASQRAGKKVAAAFTGMGIAAGYAAIAIGKDSVQAAVDDEASQAKLAKTLENVTGATDESLKKTEAWIEKQQFASGFSDGVLRDSLGRLARSTGDVEEAQGLLNLAMDISRGTGKDLETVSLALGKAYDGNEGSLKKLGIPLDDAILKSGDFRDITDELTRLFGGSAAAYTETYQGKLDIVNQRLGELKESAGAGLLDVLGNLLGKVNEVAVGFSGQSNSLAESMSSVTREGYYSPSNGENLGSALKNVADSMGQLFTTINGDGKKSAGNLQTIADALNAVASAIDKLNAAGEFYQKHFGKDTTLGKMLRFNLQDALTPKGGRAAGGSVSAGQAYTVGEFGRETFIPNTSGRIVPNAGGGGVNITINGAIDPEGVRRQLERLFQDSGRRTAAVNLVGSAL